jgi:hypothetical protein
MSRVLNLEGVLTDMLPNEMRNHHLIMDDD